MKLAWVSDLHLDFVELTEMADFWAGVQAEAPDGILIGGDLSQAPRLLVDLKIIERLGIPFYFVLGNHEFYRGSIEEVRWAARQFSDESTLGTWLGGAGVIELTPQVALIGHGCWGDARYGDVQHMLPLNDDVMIRELADLSLAARIRLLNQLGDEAAAHLRANLALALPKYQQIFILTHVPPFVETCLYEKGKPSPLDGLPRFACQAVGDLLKDILPPFPACHVTLLAGHTHTAADEQILPNLRVRVASAEYTQPRVADWIEV